MIPLVTDDDFSPFLRWLVREKQYGADSIINVVSEPYKYSLEYKEFLKDPQNKIINVSIKNMSDITQKNIEKLF